MKNRILVVDDDLSILELLRTLLESEGYQVQAFDSGAAALRNALKHPPDAAIIDLMMPGMNGLDLVHALRYDRRTHQIPVLICSAYYGNLRHITEDLQQDNTSCLRKPFQLQELLDLVARMVEIHRVSRQNGHKELQPEPPTPIASTPGSWSPLIAPPTRRAARRRSVPGPKEAIGTSGNSSLAPVQPRAQPETGDSLDSLGQSGAGGV